MKKIILLIFFIQTNLFSQDYQVKYPFIPNQVFFCDELVPLDQEDIYERLEKEMIVNTYWHSKTLLTYKRSKILSYY